MSELKIQTEQDIVRHAEYMVDAYLARRDGHSRANLIESVRADRRELLTDVLARCHHRPDAPAQTLIRFIHKLIEETVL